MAGRILSHYRLLGEISRGGMGVVYRAVDLKLNREIALKLLPPELVSDPERKRRFVQEAQAAARLKHPNIAVVYEIDETDDATFIAMELIEGEKLSDTFALGRISLSRGLDIAREVAAGLAHAHAKGIVHRDLKPANIMVTEEGGAKIIDFGLAKLVEPLSGDPSEAETALVGQTEPGVVMGTFAYMSPEQARGKMVDQRSDIFSLGIVLYNMLTGRLPFRGETAAETLGAILTTPTPRLSDASPAGADGALQEILDRCLAKEPASRYQTVEELVRALDSLRHRFQADAAGGELFSGFLRFVKRPVIATTASLALILAGALLAWFFHQERKARWAREVAIPEIVRLIDEDSYVAAFTLGKEAERYLPDDPTFRALRPQMSRLVTISTDPGGARVFFRAYGRPDDPWKLLGLSPREALELPKGPFWVRVEKEGYEPIETLMPREDYSDETVITFSFPLEKKGVIPPDMVGIPPAELFLDFAGYQMVPSYAASSYLIDKHEVTNEEFKQFVDSGGYRAREFWKHEFVKEGRPLSWEQAMAEFRDYTGRPGPSTWAGGTYPEGQASYPVCGVSWYEAAAYAEFSGKSVPTVYHWLGATYVWRAEDLLSISNIAGNELRPVGGTAVGFHGTYDMAGNVKEWCWNASRDQRYILGGSWNEPAHMFFEPDLLSPFDRSPVNGFRLTRHLEGSDENLPAMMQPIPRPLGARSEETPVPDEIFRAYLTQFDYDPTPLNPVVESTDEGSSYWRKERVSFDAAYGGERLIAFLFLPKNVVPPYQTVVYFPASGAQQQRTSDHIEQLSAIDFVVMGGRAVLYPIYRGTYERNDYGLKFTDANPTRAYVDHVIWWMKDLKRSVDYLETRDEIDSDKIGFYGFSWGARIGSIALAVEERFKVGVLLAGGLNALPPRPEVSEINYAPRVKVPVLMINGAHDAIFPLETSQKVMLGRLGTPDQHKQHVVFDTGHAVFEQYRNQVIERVRDWFDRYLGLVRER